GRPRAGQDEAAQPTAQPALDLERNAVAEAFRILVRLARRGREPTQAHHFHAVAEELRQIRHESLRPYQRALVFPRTVNTGQVAVETTRLATLPRKNLASPVRPWVPITTRSARLDRAAFVICSYGMPSIKRPLTRTRAFFALARRRSSCVLACAR